MRRPSTQLSAVLRLAGSVTLAALLALPAVGLVCPPEMGDFCPLQAAQDCAMGSGEMDHDGHGMTEHRASTPGETVGTGSGPMSCCIEADTSAPTSQATLPPAPDAFAAPVAVLQVWLPTPAPAPSIPASDPDLQAPSPPLYTLHSILLS